MWVQIVVAQIVYTLLLLSPICADRLILVFKLNLSAFNLFGTHPLKSQVVVDIFCRLFFHYEEFLLRFLVFYLNFLEQVFVVLKLDLFGYFISRNSKHLLSPLFDLNESVVRLDLLRRLAEYVVVSALL